VGHNSCPQFLDAKELCRGEQVYLRVHVLVNLNLPRCFLKGRVQLVLPTLDFVNFREHDLNFLVVVAELVKHFYVTCLQTMFSINKHDDEGESYRVAEVTRHQLLEIILYFYWEVGVAIARTVNNHSLKSLLLNSPAATTTYSNCVSTAALGLLDEVEVQTLGLSALLGNTCDVNTFVESVNE